MDDSAKIYLGIALMIVMIGMGLSLTTQDFKRIVLYPKAIILGMITSDTICSRCKHNAKEHNIFYKPFTKFFEGNPPYIIDLFS